MQKYCSLPHFGLSSRSIWIGLCAGMLAGCASGPDFKPPASPDVAGYTASVLPAQTVAAPTALGGAQRFVAGAPVAAQWWRQFGSARLDALIETALRASPTLEAAQATAQKYFRSYGTAHQGRKCQGREQQIDQFGIGNCNKDRHLDAE